VVGTSRLVVLPERGAITAITILLRSLEHCPARQQLAEGDAGAVRVQVPGQGAVPALPGKIGPSSPDKPAGRARDRTAPVGRRQRRPASR